MSKDAAHNCTRCFTCQVNKAPEQIPVPLQPVISTKPWELVAVDILKILMSAKGNRFMVVIQDYFSKWLFAWALPDQRLRKLFRFLEIMNHGISWTLTKAPFRSRAKFWKSDTLQFMYSLWNQEKPYHPMGDGVVERMNRSSPSLSLTLTLTLSHSHTLTLSLSHSLTLSLSQGETPSITPIHI